MCLRNLFLLFSVVFLTGYTNNTDQKNAQPLINKQWYSEEERLLLDQGHRLLFEKYQIKALAYPFIFAKEFERIDFTQTALGCAFADILRECFNYEIGFHGATNFEHYTDIIPSEIQKGVCISICDYVSAARKQHLEQPLFSIITSIDGVKHDIVVLQCIYGCQVDLHNCIELNNHSLTLDRLYQKYVFSSKYQNKSSKSIYSAVYKIYNNEDDLSINIKKAHEFCKKHKITKFSDDKFQKLRADILIKHSQKCYGASHALLTSESRVIAEECIRKLQNIRNEYLTGQLKTKKSSSNYLLKNSREMQKLHSKVQGYLTGSITGELRVIYHGEHASHVLSIFHEKKHDLLLDQNSGVFESLNRDQFILWIKNKFLSHIYPDILGYKNSSITIEWIADT